MKKTFFTLALAILAFNFAFSQKWEKVADFPGTAPRGAVAFSIGNYGYVGLGDNNQKEFWKYDPVTDKWTSIAPFPGIPRVGAAAAVVNGKVYVGLGGQENFSGDATDAYNDFYEYDPNTNKWTPKATCPVKVKGSAYFGFDDTNGGSVYVTMGLDESNSFITDVLTYSPKTDTWTKTPNVKMPANGYPLHSVVSFMWNKKAYFSGGRNSGTIYSSIFSFDPAKIATNPWEELNKNNNFKMGYAGSASFGIGNKAYVAYGKNGKDIIEYDATTQFLTTLTDPFAAKDEIQGLSCFVINNTKAYAIGGTIGWSSLSPPNKSVWTLGKLTLPTKQITIENAEIKYFSSNKTIQVVANQNIVSVETYSIDGKLMASSKNINMPFFEKSYNDLSTGIYIVKMNTAEGTLTKKIFID